MLQQITVPVKSFGYSKIVFMLNSVISFEEECTICLLLSERFLQRHLELRGREVPYKSFFRQRRLCSWLMVISVVICRVCWTSHEL